MEFEPQDQEIVSLLTKLKGAEGQYPESMLVARREMFLQRMSEISMGIPPDAGIPDAAASSGPPPISPVTGTILETALLVAIILEASAVAYFYRDQLADFFETVALEPRVEMVASPPVPTTAIEIQGIMPSPVIPLTLPPTALVISPTPITTTVAPAITPLPGVAEENEPDNINGAGSVTLGSTPMPGGNTTSTSGQGNNGGQTLEPEPTRDNNGNQGGQTPEPEPSRDNNGNHYGQTPRPERTKENNGNSSP